MKSRFSTHISYFWWLYVLIAVVFTLFWTFLVDIALQPGDTEELKIYFFCDNIDIDAFSSELTEVLPDITSQNIKSIRVGDVLNELYNPTALNSLLYARAQECDFMIVKDELIPDGSFAPAYFNIYDQAEIAAALGNVNFYVEEYKGTLYTYGIQVSGDGMKNNFTSFYGEDGKCWLMFCFKTCNMGELTGNSPNDAALQTIKWMLAEVE